MLTCAIQINLPITQYHHINASGRWCEPSPTWESRVSLRIHLGASRLHGAWPVGAPGVDLHLPLAAHLRPPAGLCVLGLLSTRKPRAGNQRTPSTTTAYFMLMTRCITPQGDITDAASNYSSRRFPAITGIHLQPKNTNAHVLFFLVLMIHIYLLLVWFVDSLWNLCSNAILLRGAWLVVVSAGARKDACFVCISFRQRYGQLVYHLPCRWKATSFWFVFLFFSRNSGEGFKVEILTPKTVNCDCLTELLAV